MYHVDVQACPESLARPMPFVNQLDRRLREVCEEDAHEVETHPFVGKACQSGLLRGLPSSNTCRACLKVKAKENEQTYVLRQLD
jgi:hypothetical protein